MRVHAQPTLSVRPGVSLSRCEFVLCNFACVVVALVVRKPSSAPVHTIGRKQATWSGAIQLVAPPLLRCFPGNSRSGWQTR